MGAKEKNISYELFIKLILLIITLSGADLKAETSKSIEDQSLNAERTHLDINLGNTQNFSHGVASEKINTTDLDINVKTELETMTIQALVSGSVKNNHNDESSLSNSVLSLEENPKEVFGAALISVVAIHATLPTDSELRESTRFQGGVGLSHTLSGSVVLMSIPTDVAWRIGISKNFHEFDLGNEGQPLVEYGVKNRLLVNGNLNSRLQLTVSIDYMNGLTYHKYSRETFSSTVQMSYKVNNNLSANFGVSTDGNAKKANELDSNVSFFNEHTSTLQSGISLQF